MKAGLTEMEQAHASLGTQTAAIAVGAPSGYHFLVVSLVCLQRSETIFFKKKVAIIFVLL
jgi:hypothetical protein